jgi:LPS export ABC transporter protein LptC/lipopolysaccharide transport protein LptA
MVMTFDADRAQGPQERGGGRATGSGIVLATDRSDSFRKARRHSQLVKVLRLALPASGALMSLLYVGALVGSGGFSSGLPEVAIPRITPQDLSMQNPNYDGVTEDGGTYKVAAARARQNFEQTDLIELESITGDLVAKDKSATKLTAVRGVFNHKENVLDLKEKIEIRSDNGFSADLTSATLRTKEGRINSDEPVRVGFPAGSVSAKRLEIRQKLREVTFVEDVAARLVPPPKASGSSDAAKPQRAPALLGTSEGPVDITAARLDIQDLDKRAIFTGTVRAVQAGTALDTPEITVTYEGGSGMPGSKPDPGSAGGKLTRIAAKGPFVITRDNGDRVTGDGATFDAVAETGLLEGNIVMTSLPDRRVTADRVELDQSRDSAVLTGDVVVVNGETVLKGRRLAINRSAGQTSLTSPPMAGSGPGRISARFVQKNTGTKKPGSADPSAGKNPTGLAEFKTSPGAPLDLEADSLDVDDNVRLAIFRGDVVTKQGEVTMRSPEIRASYTGSARLADTGGSSAQPAPGGGSQLERIDALGGVVVTTADGRKVTGSTARYEAKTNSVVVTGDVELSQQGTVVRGNRLVIDVASGKATIDTSVSKALAKPNEGWSSEVQGRSTGGRPSAIFFPDELRKAQGAGQKPSSPSKPKTGAAPEAEASGWSSETLPTKPLP